MSDIPNVNLKNTKEEILRAYQKAKDLANAKDQGKFDPQAEVRAKADVETVKAAEGITEASIGEQIADLKKKTGGYLDNLAYNVMEKHKIFSSISESIIIQRTKLEELYGIEDEALALVALVNAKTDIQEQYDARFNERKSAAEAELAIITQKALESRLALQAEQSQEKAAFAKEQSRQKNEWDYDFSRLKAKQLDTIDDEIAAKRKDLQNQVEKVNTEFSERDKAIKEREAKVVEREEAVDLESGQIETLKGQLNTIATKTEEEVTKRLTAEFNRDKEFLQKEADFEKQKLQGQVDMLNEVLAKANATNVDLSTKLDRAYQEIKDMAAKGLDSVSDRRLSENLQRLVADTANKSGQNR